MEIKRYTKADVNTIKDLIAEYGGDLKGGKGENSVPLQPGYRPKLDI